MKKKYDLISVRNEAIKYIKLTYPKVTHEDIGRLFSITKGMVSHIIKH